MTQPLPKWAPSLLIGFALAWPLQVYKYIPYLDASVTGIVVCIMAVLWFGYRNLIKIRVPVEYWWPLAGAIGFSMLSGDAKLYIMTALTFIIAVQFTRNAQWTESILLASTLSIGIIAAVNTASHTLGLLPTAYALESGVTMTGPYSVSEGFYILALGVLWGAYLTLFSSQSPEKRAITFFVTILILGALAGKVFLLRNNAYEWSASILPTSSILSLIAIIFLVWLCVRIIAKLVVTREENSKLALLLIIAICATLLYWFIFPREVRLYQAWLLGLAAGYALPDRIETPDFAWPKTVCAGLFALTALNIFHPFPIHEQDSRNIEHAAELDYANEDYPRLHQRMNSLATIYPEQLDQLYLWKARASIQQDDLDKASKEFGLAVEFWIEHGKNEDVKPQVDLVLLEMRDASSRLPEGEVSIAYERALVSMGQSESALLLLKLKLDNGDIMLPLELTAREKAFLYSALLGDTTLSTELSTWKILDTPHKDPLWNIVLEQTRPELLEPGSLVYYIDRQPNEVIFYSSIGGQLKQTSKLLPRTWQKSSAPPQDQRPASISTRRDDENTDIIRMGAPTQDDIYPIEFKIQKTSVGRVDFNLAQLNTIPYAPSIYYHPWAQVLQILK